MSTSADSNQACEQIIAELAKSYHSAEVAEPCAALDANILAAARRHVAQRQAISLIQKKPASHRRFWLQGASILACGAVAAVVFNTLHDDTGLAGFVQPASINDDATTPARPAYELPISEPLQAPAVERGGDVCVIRKADHNTGANADIAAELKRLEQAGCAASVARLRQSSSAEQRP